MYWNKITINFNFGGRVWVALTWKLLQYPIKGLSVILIGYFFVRVFLYIKNSHFHENWKLDVLCASCLFFIFPCMLFLLGQRRTSRPLHTMGFSRHYELLYNAGIQLLHAGRPLAAFDCLIETVQVYSMNPRLWLRLAECCIAANKGTPVSHTGEWTNI